MKKIKLTYNKYALVDDDDYVYLNRFKWSATKKGEDWYAQTRFRTEIKSHSSLIYMHQFLIKLYNCDCITFKNKNTLDNRKGNLIGVSRGISQTRNRKRMKNGYYNLTSIYKGVSGRRKKKVRNGKKFWESRISKNGKTYFLGLFYSAKEAAEAYNKKARELYGELAYQNKI
jgi:hypothetical protein